MVDDKVGRDLRDVAAEAAAEAFDEWLFRMHGVTSSCRHEVEGRAIADVVLAAVEPLIRAEALQNVRDSGDHLRGDFTAPGSGRCHVGGTTADCRAAAPTVEGDRPKPRTGDMHPTETAGWSLPSAASTGEDDDDPCDGTGIVECWSPGGPCPPERIATGCECCGPCQTCHPATGEGDRDA